MLPVPASVSIPMAVIGAVFLFVLGALFLFAPSKGLAATKHHGEDLPTIMAGRYFFFAFAIAIICWKGSIELVGWLFAGFAALAFFDAATYAARKKAVAPHLLAGLASLLIPVVAFGGKA